MINNIILILVIVLAVIGAGLFAGAETGIYQLSQLRLRLGIEKKRLLFVILGKTLRDRGALLLSMLVGNNLAHYLATSIVTYLLLRQLQEEHTAELFATIMTAPMLFVFAEMIPKSIFFYRSDTIMPCISPILFAFHKFLSWSGIVPLLRFISRTFAQLAGSPQPCEMAITAGQQSYIKAIFADTQEESILSPVQSDIINRLVNISNISIRSVMTPISKVQTVDVNSDNVALLDKLKKCPFTRLPVYERQPANIIGFINIYDCLSSTQACLNLHNFIKPIRKLSANVTVSDAINIMQSEKLKITLVMRAGHLGRERPIGIVTMKDLAEELLGELAQW